MVVHTDGVSAVLPVEEELCGAVHVSLGSTQAVCELKTTRPREHVCEQLHHVLLHTPSRHSRR
jgi:hypothetical protein